MISTNSIIYSFIISFISSVFLKGYEKINQKEYESGEYVKIFFIVLLSSLFTFYIKQLINPLISSFTGTKKPTNTSIQLGGSTPTVFKPPVSIPTMVPNTMNFNPSNMPFNMNKPMF
jgi:hypothetical protein